MLEKGSYHWCFHSFLICLLHFFSTFPIIPASSIKPSFGHGYKPPLFDPTHQYALRHLKQTESVSEYQLQFETIFLRVLCMSANDHRGCFIAGLHDDIRRKLTLLRPYCLSQAIRLAKNIEAKLLASEASVASILWTKSSSTAPHHSFPQLSSTNFNISKPSDDRSIASLHATVETETHTMKHVVKMVTSTELLAEG